MGDQDVEEMFHNFVLHASLRPYCGVDLTLYFPEEVVGGGVTHLIETWTRAGMGFRWSPYQCCQGMMVLDEKIGGDRLDKSNVFRWDYVRLNLSRVPKLHPEPPLGFQGSELMTARWPPTGSSLWMMGDPRGTGERRFGRLPEK